MPRARVLPRRLAGRGASRRKASLMMARFVLGLVLALPFPRAWAAPPQIETGARIVRGTCTRCHDVEADPHPARPRPGQPPAFAWIAATHPDYLEGVLLRPPHAMWPVTIQPGQRDALRAYFHSLGQQ